MSDTDKQQTDTGQPDDDTKFDEPGAESASESESPADDSDAAVDVQPDAAEEDAGNDGDVAEAAADETPATEPPATEIVIEKKGGASATIAWLALFLALTTVAGVGYLYIEKLRAESGARQESSAIAELSSQLDETTRSLTQLDASVTDLAAAESQAGEMIDSLRRELDDRAQLFDSLPPRMTSLERTVATLQGVSLDTRNTYLVAEAEYYLQIANAQLQLAGNAYLASLALEQADDRLLQLADPGLTDVRRAIADEIAALEIMEKPDVAGVSLTLASLARVVDSLPLKQPQRTGEVAAAAAADEQGSIARAWGAVKGAFTGLVRHTPPSDDTAPLLTPDAEPLIRSNLSLQLQAARLALLRGEQAIFEQSLDDASAWLDAYFDTTSEPVESAKATIVEIRDDYAVGTAPDISGSLRLLRQYKALAESAE